MENKNSKPKYKAKMKQAYIAVDGQDQHKVWVETVTELVNREPVDLCKDGILFAFGADGKKVGVVATTEPLGPEQLFRLAQELPSALLSKISHSIEAISAGKLTHENYVQLGMIMMRLQEAFARGVYDIFADTKRFDKSISENWHKAMHEAQLRYIEESTEDKQQEINDAKAKANFEKFKRKAN